MVNVSGTIPVIFFPAKETLPRMPKLTGRHAFIEQLLAEGTKYVFGNPGTTEQGFMDALQEYPRPRVHPQPARGRRIGVADGYARATGRPAFVQLHIMPGLGNAMGMLYNSYRIHTPMVIYAGQHPQRGASQEPILAGDLVRLAEPLTKWAVEAQDAARDPGPPAPRLQGGDGAAARPRLRLGARRT